MPRRSARDFAPALLGGLWLLTACEPETKVAPAVTTPAAEAATPDAAAPAVAEPSGPSPIEELAALDQRTPVPLQPMMAWHQKQNMMEHLVAIQRIVDATAKEDWKAVAEASAAIESSAQMQQMCEHMGAGAPGFTELALDFHTRADAIAVAAEAQDTKGVLEATSNTLAACTGCHSAYRQELVDAETWQERSGSAHDPAAAHGGPGGH